MAQRTAPDRTDHVIVIDAVGGVERPIEDQPPGSAREVLLDTASVDDDAPNPALESNLRGRVLVLASGVAAAEGVDLHGHPAENEILGIDHRPLALDFGGLGHIGFHGDLEEIAGCAAGRELAGSGTYADCLALSTRHAALSFRYLRVFASVLLRDQRTGGLMTA